MQTSICLLSDYGFTPKIYEKMNLQKPGQGIVFVEPLYEVDGLVNQTS